MADLKLLVLSARDVHGLLSYGECADLVAGALAARAQDYAARGRPLAGIRIAGRTPGRAARLAGELTAAAGVPVRAAGSAAEAVTGADVVVTATSSASPVLERAWLADGTHINAVGACLPHTRELDSATMAAAAVFADSRESALAESGDVRLAIAEHSSPPVHIRAEIGELLTGTGSSPGRAGDRDITVFESLGLAVEDLVAARGGTGKPPGSGRGRGWISEPVGGRAVPQVRGRGAAVEIALSPGRPAEWGTPGDNGDRRDRRLARGVLLRRGRTRPADRGPGGRGG